MASSPAVVIPPFPLADTASADLASALTEAIKEHDCALQSLLEALTTCVWSLRDHQEMPPENVVLTMKAVLRHAATGGTSRRTDHLVTLEFWMEDLVSWCIGEYFRRE